MITAKIQPWGNSQGLRLARNILNLADLAVGDEVELQVTEHEIVVRKARSRRFDLAELVARIPADYGASEVDFGPPVGREAW